VTLRKIKAVVTGSKLSGDKYKILQLGKITTTPDEINGLLGVIDRKVLKLNFYLPVYKISEGSVRRAPILFFSFLFIMYSIDQPLF
jgi:hypothetical protein